MMRTIVLMCVCVSLVSGQYSFWPDVLTAPVVEEIGDSNYIEFTSSQNLRRDIYRTNNSLALLRNDTTHFFKQVFSYDLSDDNNLGLQNHYWDFAGAYARKQFPFQFSSLGLEWIPTAAFNQRPNEKSDEQRSNGISSMRLGPTIGINYLNLPIRFSGGGAVDLWQSELPSKPGWSDIVEAKGDPGFYGGLTVGDNTKQLVDGIPLYAKGSIFGRYMSGDNNSKITNGEVNALFLQDVAFGDTLFLYAADSLSKGRSAFLSEQAGGSAKYISTPDRTNNSLQASCGVNNIGDLFLQPSFMYTFSLNSLTYPRHTEVLGDERLLRNKVSCMIHNKDHRIFGYDGGISFTFEDEDWLFRKDLSVQQNEMNKDSLVKNLQDYNGFSARMFHVVQATSDRGPAFTYAFDITRDKKTFPNYYLSPAHDTVRFYYDRDIVYLRHSADLVLLSRSKVKVSGLVDFSKRDLVYLRKEKSSSNKTERMYRLESSLQIMPGENISFKESIGAYAKNDAYHFPQYQNSGPQWARKFYSNFSGTGTIRDRLTIEGKWDEIYSDDGHWFDPDIPDPQPLPRQWEAYYAIESKSLESSLALTASYKFPTMFIVRLGDLFKYIYYQDFDVALQDYGAKNIYYMTPFIEIKAMVFSRVSLKSKIERYMDPVADDFWEANAFINVAF